MRCHTCGKALDGFDAMCPECGQDPRLLRAVASCVPVQAPMSGYLTLDELSRLADSIPDEPQALAELPEPRPEPRPGIDWLRISMTAVKWTGISTTCLTMAFFLAVILKAFM